MRVLIAGCGDVGNVLATELLRDGHVVYGLKRDTSTLPEGVRPVQADLLDPETLKDLPEEIDCLVFMPTPASRDRSSYEAIFITGWKNLWNNLKAKPERALVVSSTAVYGEDSGGIVSELSGPNPTRFNGKVLLEMERLAALDMAGLVVARISGIYGPGRERLIRLAASAQLEVQQTPPLYTNRIHRDDAARALKHILDMHKPDTLYLLTDDLPAPKFEVMAWLANEQGRPKPTGLKLEDATSGKRASNRKLRESGFDLTYPDYRAGYGAILKSRD